MEFHLHPRKLSEVFAALGVLADRDPEEARKILDPVLERMMEAVHRYEGAVNQVMSDGIGALRGAGRLTGPRGSCGAMQRFGRGTCLAVFARGSAGGA